MNNIAYIYRIRHKYKDKSYVGITRDRDVFFRWQEHPRADSKIGKAIEEEGIESFVFEVLERHGNISDSDLFKRETLYIEALNSIENGYNVIHSKEQEKVDVLPERALQGLKYLETLTYLGTPGNNDNNRYSFWHKLGSDNLCILSLLSSVNYFTNKTSKYYNLLHKTFYKREQRLFSIESLGSEYYIESLDEIISLLMAAYRDIPAPYEVLYYSEGGNYLEFIIKDIDSEKSRRFKLYGQLIYSDETLYKEKIKRIDELLD